MVMMPLVVTTRLLFGPDSHSNRPVRLARPDSSILVAEEKEIRALLRAERPTVSVVSAFVAIVLEADDAFLQALLFLGRPASIAMIVHGGRPFFRTPRDFLTVAPKLF